ncbi:MAG TPA: FtsX-like permease family protein, partial [Candidatus Acidoferrales bacterium]
IRVALGAQSGDLFGSVVGQGMAIAAAGAVVGVLGALGTTRFLTTLLYEVSPVDPVVYGVVAAALGGVAFAACWVPARRASRVDPMVALRHE